MIGDYPSPCLIWAFVLADIALALLWAWSWVLAR